MCKGVNENANLKINRLELEHKGQYIDQLERGNITEIPSYDATSSLTFVETACR